MLAHLKLVPLGTRFALSLVCLGLFVLSVRAEDAPAIVHAVVQGESQIPEFRARVVISIDGRRGWDLDWGYDHGKEFYSGTQYVTGIPGKSEPVPQRIKWAFDGDKMRGIRSHLAKKVDTGKIAGLDPELFRGVPNPRTLLGSDIRFEGRQSLGEVLAAASDITLLPDLEVVDGHRCHVLQLRKVDKTHDGRVFDARVWIDTERGSRPLKYEKYRSDDGRLAWKALYERVENIRLQKIDGVWFPTHGEYQQFGYDFVPAPGHTEQELSRLPMADAMQKVDVVLRPSAKYSVDIDPESIQINKGIPAAEFTIVFPQGCLITDEFTRLTYTVGEIPEGPDVLHSLEATAATSATTRETTSMPVAQTVQPGFPLGKMTIAILCGAGLMAVALIAAIAKKKHNRVR